MLDAAVGGENPIKININIILNQDIFGGALRRVHPLTIEDFRRNLFKIDYRPMGDILLPTSRSVGFLFEKQIRI